jgi:hypothetical protein
MSILAGAGAAAVGVICGLFAMFINWRHNRGDRFATFLALVSGALLAASVAGFFTDITGLEIFGVSATVAIAIWGVTWTMLEGWHRVDFHSYRTLIIAWVTGVDLALASSNFHLAAPGAGVLLAGEAAILAYKDRAPRLTVWLAVGAGLLLAANFTGAIVGFTGEIGVGLLVAFAVGVILLAEAWWSGHKQGPRRHAMLTPAAGFAGALLVLTASGGAVHGLATHAQNTTLTAVNTVGGHTGFLSDLVHRFGSSAVTVAHKAGGQ